MTDTITLPRSKVKEILRALRTFDAGAMIKAEQMFVTALAQQAATCNSDLIGFLPSEEKRQQTVISQTELRAVLAQPVREPLTDERIQERTKQQWVFETVKQWVKEIEKAHGIGGER